MKQNPNIMVRLLLLLALIMVPLQAIGRDAFVPIMYRISDADNSLYVLGSIHQLDEENAALPGIVTDVFDRAVVSVFELPAKDIEANREQVLGEFMRYAYFDDGQRLQSFLTPQEILALRERLTAMGLKESQWQMMRPWLIGLLLELDDLRDKGLQSEHGIDLQLIRRGTQTGKQQDALESLSDQLHALSSTPMEEQVADLTEQLDPAKVKDGDEKSEQMLMAWKLGDVAAMTKLEEQFRREYPRTHQTIITDRNQRWIPKLKAYLDDRTSGDVIAVVGALHLIGDHGVVKLLEQQGYKVERVTQTAR